MKQLLFDCDGVLVDSEIIAAHKMVEFVGEIGNPITLEYYLNNCTGRTFSGILKEMEAKNEVELPSNYLGILSDRVEAAFKKELKAVAGMEGVVERFGSIAAVVSNSDPEQIDSALQISKLNQHIKGPLFSASLVDFPKPAPDVYLNAMQELRAVPEKSWTVEDSISGATSAKAAGLNVIGFLGGKHIVEGHADKLLEVGVDLVASDANELKLMLQELSF